MFIVLELQTNGGSTSIVPVTTYDSRNAAEAEFHRVLSFAATSNVEVHTAMIIGENGEVYDKRSYRHGSNLPPVEEE